MRKRLPYLVIGLLWVVLLSVIFVGNTRRGFHGNKEEVEELRQCVQQWKAMNNSGRLPPYLRKRVDYWNGRIERSHYYNSRWWLDLLAHDGWDEVELIKLPHEP